jgi:hypothetical protein
VPSPTPTTSLSISKDERDATLEKLQTYIADSTAPPAIRKDFWDEFALWHPFLFLFVDSLQFLNKMLIAPRKIFCTREEK